MDKAIQQLEDLIKEITTLKVIIEENANRIDTHTVLVLVDELNETLTSSDFAEVYYNLV